MADKPLEPLAFTEGEGAFLLQLLGSISYKGEDAVRTVVAVLDKLRKAGAKKPPEPSPFPPGFEPGPPPKKQIPVPAPPVSKS